MIFLGKILGADSILQQSALKIIERLVILGDFIVFVGLKHAVKPRRDGNELLLRKLSIPIAALLIQIL